MSISRSVQTPPPYGLTNADQPYLIENIVEGLAMDVLRRESFLGKISNTKALKKLEQFGDTITFRVLNPPTVSAYVTDQALTAQMVTGSNFSVTVNQAWYAYFVVDPIDIKQINLPLMEELARQMALAHAQNEYTVVLAGAIATIYGAAVMAYLGQVAGTVAYNPNVPTFVSSPDRTDPDYIINQFLALRTAYNKLGIPKTGRYCMINSDVEQIVLASDQMVYWVNGEGNKKAIEDGDYGMRLAGFDLIVSDDIPTAAYGGQQNICQGISGHVNGLGFVRQLQETELSFKLQTSFERASRQLDVFGYGFSDSRLMGAQPLKVA